MGARPLDLLLRNIHINLEVGLFLFVVLIAEASVLTEESVSLYSSLQIYCAQPVSLAPTKLQIPMVRT